MKIFTIPGMADQRHNHALKKLILVMKLTTLFVILGLLSVSAHTYSQVTLHVKNAPFTQVIKTIEAQTGYAFSYDKNAIETGSVTLTLNNASLEKTLSELLADKPVTYSIVDKNIILQPKEPSFMDKLKDALTPPTTVQGKVTDETGAPLVGVTVRIKGSSNGTTTDSKGVFAIAVPDDKTVLVFTFIGFETQEFVAKDVVSGSTIILKASNTNLKEVVVNKGYYNTTQELNTGNVTRITANEISQQPLNNPIFALSGRVAGLYVQQLSGIPGGDMTVRIRGQNSIANGNDPLYIVDGVPYSSTTLSHDAFFFLGSSSPLNYINPSDIENIDVLKDADATAIYGSRGANGVILITTKNGKSGKSKLNLNFYSGNGKVGHMMDLLNTQQYLTMRKEAFKNDGISAIPSSAYDVNGRWDTTRYTNWQKELLGGTSHYSDIQASISGGTTNTQYLLSGGYHRETSVFPTEGSDQKASAHLNINNVSANGKLHLLLSINYVYGKNDLPNVDLTNQALLLPPDAPALYNSDGTLNWQNSTWTNPLSLLLNRYSGDSNNLISNLSIDYKVFPTLQAKINFGYNNTSLKQKNIFPISAYDPFYVSTYPQYFPGQSYFANTSANSFIIEPQLSYQQAVGPGTLDLLLGGTIQSNSTDYLSILGSGFTSDAYIYNTSLAPSRTVANGLTEYKYGAIFGRLNYNINNKYLINFTARRDGSSRFGPGRQFGNFGAIGTGWIFSKENFVLNTLPWLSIGKIRASYGVTGNDQTGDYQYLNTFVAPASTAQTYQGVAALIPSGLYNPEFGWETNKKLEIGLSLGFFNDKLMINADYFKNRSSNQLVGYSLPPTTGASTVVANLPATVQNTGIELDVQSVILKSKLIEWRSAFNITFPRNKLIAYPNLESSSYANTYIVGQSLYIQQLYKYTGINPVTGTYTFATQNSDGIPTTPADLTTAKETTQFYYGGFQNSLTIGNFGMDFLFQFVKQNARNIFRGFSLPGINQNRPVQFLDHWQTSTDNAYVEKYSQNFGSVAGQAFQNLQRSDRTISDASFIRLKTLNLFYQLPQSLISKLKIENAKIYLQGQNLFTLTNYIGLDPEQPFIQNLPSLKVITLGVQLTF